MIEKQDEKKLQNKFFDRQIQIFGEEIQSKIIQTQIQVFSCDSTSSEILKNLVLIGFKVLITNKDELTESSYTKNPLIYSNNNNDDKLLSTVILRSLQEFSNFNQVSISDNLDKETKIIICGIKNKDDYVQYQEQFKDFEGLIIYFSQQKFSITIFLQHKKQLNDKFFECFKDSQNIQFQDFYKKFQENQKLIYEPEVFISSICGSFVNQVVLQYINNPNLIFSALCLNLGDFLDNPVTLNSSHSEYFEYQFHQIYLIYYLFFLINTYL